VGEGVEILGQSSGFPDIGGRARRDCGQVP
jgi:hypothetical protein